MRSLPVHVSCLKEACNALTYWHFSFHMGNWPHLGRQLKYFVRLVAIGFAYEGRLTIADCGFRVAERRSGE
jgi:hypothetical protein